MRLYLSIKSNKRKKRIMEEKEKEVEGSNENNRILRNRMRLFLTHLTANLILRLVKWQ
jgi:hypothetical protein